MNASRIRVAIIVVVLLQALVLVLLPLRAGHRIPSGTTVVLAATAGSQPEFPKDMASQELWLDYDFDELDVPDDVKAGEIVAVRVRPTGDSEPARLGPVVEDAADLPDGAIWINLPTITSKAGDVTVDAGPIQVWFHEDFDRIEALRDELEDGDEAVVTIELDNDGDPTIESVEAD